MTNFILVVLLAVLVALLVWRQNQVRVPMEREREERRARTDQLLARSLVSEDRPERHTRGRAAVRFVAEDLPDTQAVGHRGRSPRPATGRYRYPARR